MNSSDDSDVKTVDVITRKRSENTEYTEECIEFRRRLQALVEDLESEGHLLSAVHVSTAIDLLLTKVDPKWT